MLLFQPSPEHLFAEDMLSDSDTRGLVSQLDQIAYCSVAVPSVMSLRISDWIAQANSEGNRDTSQPSISGMLMWEGRLMIHWLEGSQEQLDRLWALIQADTGQHCLVPLLRRRGVAKRLFVGWQMLAVSRNEMISIVREVKEQASLNTGLQEASWRHAISTLSVLLDPDLTVCYAQATKPTPSLALQTTMTAYERELHNMAEVRSA